MIGWGLSRICSTRSPVRHAREFEEFVAPHARQRADDLVHVSAGADVPPAPVMTTDFTSLVAPRARKRSHSPHRINVSGFLRSRSIQRDDTDLVLEAPQKVLRYIVRVAHDRGPFSATRRRVALVFKGREQFRKESLLLHSQIVKEIDDPAARARCAIR